MNKARSHPPGSVVITPATLGDQALSNADLGLLVRGLYAIKEGGCARDQELVTRLASGEFGGRAVQPEEIIAGLERLLEAGTIAGLERLLDEPGPDPSRS